jgi:hypothetical protein
MIVEALLARGEGETKRGESVEKGCEDDRTRAHHLLSALWRSRSYSTTQLHSIPGTPLPSFISDVLNLTPSLCPRSR